MISDEGIVDLSFKNRFGIELMYQTKSSSRKTQRDIDYSVIPLFCT